MKIKILLSVMIVAILSSCTSRQEASFQDLFPGTSFNDEITMKWNELEPSNSTNNRKVIGFDIINHTQSTVSYHVQDGGSIFYFDEGQAMWIGVEDTMRRSNYFGDYIFISPKSEDSPGEVFLPYKPDISGMKEEMKLRFVVTGILTTPDKEEKPVGAYLDLVISP